MNATTTQVGLDASTNTRYLAFDLRLGAAVGVTLFERFRPYALARIFGGPIFWSYRGESLTGTNIYKYQFGGGASVSIANGVSVFAEGVFPGKQALQGALDLPFSARRLTRRRPSTEACGASQYIDWLARTTLESSSSPLRAQGSRISRKGFSRE